MSRKTNLSVVTTTKPNAEKKRMNHALDLLLEADDALVARCELRIEQGQPLEPLFKDTPHQELPRRVQVLLARERANQSTIRLEIEVPADVYATLCGAALVHGISWQEAALKLIELRLGEWQEDGYVDAV